MANWLHSNSKWIKIVLLVILVGLIIGTAYFVYKSYKTTNDLNNSSANTKTVVVVGKKTATTTAPTPQPTTPTPAPTPSPTPQTVAVCLTVDLKLSLGQPNNAAGHSYIDLIMTNQTTHECTISGIPTVTLTDSQNHPLGAAASSVGVTAPYAVITLQPNQTAHAIAGFPNAGNYPAGTCSMASTFINVVPPNNTTQLQANLAEQNCPGFSITAVSTGN